MLTMLIAIAAGVGVYFFTRDLPHFGVWAYVCAVAAALLVNVLASLLIRRRINAVNRDIQQVMEKAQAVINRKIQQFQQRPAGSVKVAQQMIEKDQNAALREALKITDRAKPFYPWSLMLKKQMRTMQMMLYFQLKEFKKVDELLPHCFVLDSRSVAVKAVRMYKNSDPRLDRFMRSKCRKFKGEDLALIASLYAWMLLKLDRVSDAVDVLVKARERTDNAVVAENYERLANGKVKHFNNGGLGESWYALYLEEPKVKQQRVIQRGR